MTVWCSASAYLARDFTPALEMECDALRLVQRRLGLESQELMVPPYRSPEAGAEVSALLADRAHGPEADVRLSFMIELPSNAIEADRSNDAMDLRGGSIGSNGPVPTVHAVGRDDLESYRHAVNAPSPAVQRMIADAISPHRRGGLEIGICGQAPGDHRDVIPAFLVRCGISSISVTANTALDARLAVAKAEADVAGRAAPPARSAGEGARGPLAHFGRGRSPSFTATAFSARSLSTSSWTSVPGA